MDMTRTALLTLALLTLSACSSLEPVALEPRDRDYLRGVLAAPVTSDLAAAAWPDSATATDGPTAATDGPTAPTAALEPSAGAVAAVTSLDGVAQLVRRSRRGVVELRVDVAPSALGYLGGLGAASLSAVSNLPNPWSILQPPVYLLFGWVLEFFKESRGTGFVIGRDGETVWILTNAHVIGEDPQRILVTTWDGRPRDGGVAVPGSSDEGWKARVAWIDHDLDCALLRAHVPDREGGAVLPLGSAHEDLLGEFCVALGYPLRSESSRQLPRYCTATLGLVSSFDVSPRIHKGAYSRFGGPVGVLQTDAALNPGNSGGPLLDLHGRVIGINASIVLGADNIGFAIPIDWIREAILDHIGVGGDEVDDTGGGS